MPEAHHPSAAAGRAGDRPLAQSALAATKKKALRERRIVVFIDGKYVYSCSGYSSYAEGITACAALLGARDRVNTYVLPDDEDEMIAQQSAGELAQVPSWRHGVG